MIMLFRTPLCQNQLCDLQGEPQEAPTLPRATLKKMAPRPQSQARRKLSSASVVSTTSTVSMNTSLCAIKSWTTPICCHSISSCSNTEHKAKDYSWQFAFYQLMHRSQECHPTTGSNVKTGGHH